MKEYNISKNSLPARIYKEAYRKNNDEDLPQNGCKFGWLFILALILSPIIYPLLLPDFLMRGIYSTLYKFNSGERGIKDYSFSIIVWVIFIWVFAPLITYMFTGSFTVAKEEENIFLYSFWLILISIASVFIMYMVGYCFILSLLFIFKKLSQLFSIKLSEDKNSQEFLGVFGIIKLKIKSWYENSCPKINWIDEEREEK